MDRKPAPDSAFTAHYIASTHWDREWYQTFQDFRIRLVHVMDGVLDVLDKDPRYAVFHGDGQAIIFRDYLEVRPAQRERIARLAQAGRLLIGPWYVLPDEFLVSGEALLRNLLAGHALARSLGAEPMKFGYLCDEFGHISQMPQILANFAIESALVGRGTNEKTHPAHFIWEAPDGSRVLTYKLPDGGGYGAMTSASRPNFQRTARKSRRDADGQVVDWLEQPDLDAQLQEYVTHEMGRTNIGLIMLIDGVDHYPVNAQTPEILDRLRSLFPDVEVVHSSLPAYAGAMKKQSLKLPIVRGELRDTAQGQGGYLWLISNCLSSRYPLKQANDANQTLLERWADPYLAWANLAGARHLPASFLDLAWDFTLQNHPHDSMCGCSLDQVHKDMEYRFDQARLIGEGVVKKALQVLVPGEEQELKDPAGFQVALAQAEPYPRREVVVFDISFPTDWQERFHEGFIGEDKNSFRLYDADGRQAPYQLLSVQRQRTMTKDHPDSLVDTIKRDVHTVAAEVSLPALGYATLEVRPTSGPVRAWGSLRNGLLSAENEHLSVSVNSNGTLRMTDKATERTFDQALTFVDDGEVGDGWFHIAPINDELVSSAASACDAGVIADGPLLTTFRLRTHMQVPAAFDWIAACRSHEKRDLVISSDVTLSKGARHLLVNTTVENCVKDHRLRLLLPTGLRTESWWVDLPFDLVERRIALDPANVESKELSVPEKNMLAIAALTEEYAGLAFVSGGGLHEAAAHEDSQHTLAITLLRGFHQPVATDGQIGGQILGQHVFRYAIAPFSGAADFGRLLMLRDQIATGIRTAQTSDGFGAGRRAASLLYLEPREIRLSALKPAADGRGFILRFYNPLAAPLKVAVTPGFPVKKAVSTNAGEEDGKALVLRGSSFEVLAPPKKIISVRLE